MPVGTGGTGDVVDSKTKGSLSSHPYDNGPARQRVPVLSYQGWCFICEEKHPYHKPTRAEKRARIERSQP